MIFFNLWALRGILVIFSACHVFQGLGVRNGNFTKTTNGVKNGAFHANFALPGADTCLECRKWGCNKWGFKGCLASCPGNRPKSAFFALFLPFSAFSGGPGQHLKSPENGGKRPFFLRYPGTPTCGNSGPSQILVCLSNFSGRWWGYYG